MADRYEAHYEFTRIMESIFTHEKDLSAFHSRRELEECLQSLQEANDINRRWRERDFRNLCSEMELDADALLKDPGLLETVPSDDQMLSSLLTMFYELCAKAPGPADYMERLVRRLAPDYDGDTVRTAILKKFLVGGGVKWGGYDASAILRDAMQDATAQEKKAFEKADEAEQIELAVKRLDDAVFRPERLNPVLPEKNILKLILRRVDMLRRDRIVVATGPDGKEELTGLGALELSGETLERLQQVCGARKMALSAEPEEALRQLLEHWDEGEDLRQLVKQLRTEFIRQLQHTSYQNQKGKKAAANELFKNDERDELRSLQQDWALLVLCDQLAQGAFKNNNGMTRRNLYYFAFMFGMSVQLLDDDPVNPETDLAKNLFQDYYNDNLATFLLEGEEERRASGKYETEPTGEGINFKNFSEVIYLFYLWRNDPDMTPGQAITAAERTITACCTEAKKHPAVKQEERTADRPDQQPTGYYRSRAVDAFLDICRKERELLRSKRKITPAVANEKARMIRSQLVSFITEHYVVLQPDTAHGVSRMALSAQQNTATRIVGQMIEDMDSEMQRPGSGEPLMKKPAEKAVELFGDQLYQKLEQQYRQDPRFIRLLTHLQQMRPVNVVWLGSSRQMMLIDTLFALALSTPKPAGFRTICSRVALMMENRPLLPKNKAETLPEIDSGLVRQMLEHLRQLGFRVDHDTDNTDNYCLGGFEDEDPERNGILQTLREEKYLLLSYKDTDFSVFRPGSGVMQTIRTLVEQKINTSQSMTRSTMIFYAASNFLMSAGDGDDDDGYLYQSLGDLYRQFCKKLNPMLLEARFQPFTTKNIFDMYILISLFLYLCENN